MWTRKTNAIISILTFLTGRTAFPDFSLIFPKKRTFFSDFSLKSKNQALIASFSRCATNPDISILSQPISNVPTCSVWWTPCWKLGQLLFKTFFFRIKAWNELNINIRSSTSFLGFKNAVLKEIRSLPSSVFAVHICLLGLKFSTRFRMSFSRLQAHKFKHNFQETLDPFCNCWLDIETKAHFFLYYYNFMHLCQTRLNSPSQINHGTLKWKSPNWYIIVCKFQWKGLRKL